MWFPVCSSYKLWRYLLPFSRYSTWEILFWPPILGVLGVKDPQIVTVDISRPQNGVPYADPRILSHFGHFEDFPFGLWPCQGSFFRKWMTLNCEFQGQPRSNIMTDLNSQHMVSYLLPLQYGHLSFTVWPQYVIYRCALSLETDDLEI